MKNVIVTIEEFEFFNKFKLDSIISSYNNSNWGNDILYFELVNKIIYIIRPSNKNKPRYINNFNNVDMIDFEWFDKDNTINNYHTLSKFIIPIFKNKLKLIHRDKILDELLK